MFFYLQRRKVGLKQKTRTCVTMAGMQCLLMQVRENTLQLKKKNILGSEVQEHQRGQTFFDDLCLGIGLNIVVRSQGIHIWPNT